MGCQGPVSTLYSGKKLSANGALDNICGIHVAPHLSVAKQLLLFGLPNGE